MFLPLLAPQMAVQSASSSTVPTPPAAAPATADRADSRPRVEIRAESLGRALPEIGRALGEPMRAAPIVAGEILIASLPQGTTAAAFRGEIASSFGGEWRKDENGVWAFNRSIALRREEEKRDHARAVQQVKKSIAKALGLLVKTPELDGPAADALAKEYRSFTALPPPRDGDYNNAYWRKAQALDNRGPGHRAMLRLLAIVPPDILADTQEDGRTVYSTKPTSMQKPMPFDLAPILDTYVREQNAWANAAGSFEQPDGGYYTSIGYRIEHVQRLPATATIVIDDRYGYRSLRLKAYDDKGRTIIEDQQGFYGEFDGQDDPAAKPPPPDSFRVDYAPESRLFAKRMMYGGKISRADMAPFLDVLSRDPLGYAASDFLLSYARAKGKPLIARCSDEFLYFGWNVSANPPKDGQPETADANALNWIADRDTDGDWLLVAPKDGGRARRRFFPRGDLARALAIVASAKRLTVDKQAELALTLPQAARQSPLVRLVALAAGQENIDIGNDMVRLYGTLDEFQRRTAQSEGGLALSRLSSEQREIVRKFVFEGDEWNLQYQVDYATTPENETPEQQQQRYQALNEEQNLFYGGYLREPTFSLPDGIPSEAVLKIVRSQDDKVKTGPVSQRWGTGGGQIYDAAGLAQARFEADNPRRFPWAQDEWSRKNFDQIMLVNQESVTMTLQLTKKISANAGMSSEESLGDEVYTLNTLPARFLDAYRKRYQEVVNEYRDQPIPDYGDWYNNRNRRSTPP